jgi:hypothetical protein
MFGGNQNNKKGLFESAEQHPQQNITNTFGFDNPQGVPINNLSKGIVLLNLGFAKEVTSYLEI